MYVTNNYTQTIEVAISHWDNSGSTSFYPLAPGIGDNWKRNDDRGFIMSIKVRGAQLPYFVQSADNIVVEEASGSTPYKVLANGRLIAALV